MRAPTPRGQPWSSAPEGVPALGLQVVAARGGPEPVNNPVGRAARRLAQFRATARPAAVAAVP